MVSKIDLDFPSPQFSDICKSKSLLFQIVSQKCVRLFKISESISTVLFQNIHGVQDQACFAIVLGAPCTEMIVDSNLRMLLLMVSVA